jgi:hypothetical protein
MAPSSTIDARFCSCGSSRGCASKPSGRLTCESTMRLITSSLTAVVTSAHSGSGSATPMVRGGGGCCIASRVSVNTFSSWSW